jgi:hypothetical protein
MALWNHLVPDLVERSVQERDMDKLPHSRFPSSTNGNGEFGNELKNGKSGSTTTTSVSREDGPKRTPTFGLGGEIIAVTEVKYYSFGSRILQNTP